MVGVTLFLRLVGAVVGGYGLSSLLVALLAVLLVRIGIARSEAVVSASMAGFLIYLALLVWAFGAVRLRTLSVSLAAGSGAAFPQTDPATDEPLISYALQFQAIPRYYDSSGSLVDWTATSPSNPSVLNVTIRFLDESSASRFRNEQDWARLATAPSPQEKQFIHSFERTFALAP